MKRLAIFICALWVTVTFTSDLLFAQELSDEDLKRQEERLTEQLEELDAEIAAETQKLNQKKAETATIQRDIDILEGEIRKSELEIQRRNLAIGDLSGGIEESVQTLSALEQELLREKASLAQLIRRTNQIDDTSLIEIVLGNDDLSEFFENIDKYNVIKAELHNSFRGIETAQELTAQEQQELELEREEEYKLREIQVLEKQKIEEQEEEKALLRDISKVQEATYEVVIAQKQQTAAEIRARLFKLRGTGAIPFGEAVQHALLVEKQTGVRAALILGILQQETKLGENVGQCNLPDDPPQYKWYSIMKPERDVEPYKQIMDKLGFGYEDMPLSCAPGYGYGGAMGPAQFIPSTWVLVEDEVGSLTGHVPPNPWNPADAFMASGILLRDNGAGAGTFAAERLAALRYFAGWGNADKPQFAFYGNSVMEFATGFQKDIDFLAAN